MSLSYLKAFAIDSNFSSLGNTKHCMMVNTVDGEHRGWSTPWMVNTVDGEHRGW